MVTQFNVAFEENKLSDTVIEFKAIRKRRDHVETILALLILGLLIFSVVNAVPIHVHIISSLVIIFIVIAHRTHIVEESVLVARDFGVQLRQKDASGAEYTKFLDRNKIGSVFIHECIRGSGVTYQLAFLLRGEPGAEGTLSLSFKHVYPGLDALEQVYKAISL